MKKIKEEDLILYLYNECSPRLKAAIEPALGEDIELQDQLDVLHRSIKQLDKLQLHAPSRQSLKTIIKHAHEAARKK